MLVVGALCVAEPVRVATAQPLAQAPVERTPVDTLPPITAGPFKPTAASLKQWRAPEWFRDAKLWKAEKWQPDSFMALYVKAGAHYFVTMGVHHDSFDLWNSKYHTWNAVNMGPHRDVVGEWKRAAARYHLPFGVSEHLGPSFGWFSPSHGWDQWGPKAGVPYDGQDPKYAELYHPANNEPFHWGRSWYATDPQWHVEWFNRIKDLIDQYHPDLLYTDGGIPFESFGRSMVAHLYNTSIAAHGGTLQAVYTHKDLGTGEFIREAGAQDVERIYGTRPWKVSGEGPTVVQAGAFQESDRSTPQDVRFTTKHGALYAITLGVPTGEVRIRALGTEATARVASVRLLGSPEKLVWSQQGDALVIRVPATMPSQHAAAFRIGFARAS